MRLEVHGLSVRYGAAEALRSVDLAIEPDAVTALVGANGAGKTTLLNAVMGVVPPCGGRILMDGTEITGWPTERRVAHGLALSPEGRRLFPDLTVEENLLTGAYTRRARERAADLRGVLDLFPQLGSRRRQVARTLSGGEQQMVAIGRALMARPRLLLLDEPSLGLAPRVVAGLGEAIRGITRDGVAIVLVEQDAHWALSLARTGHLMRGGRLVRSAPASELLDDHTVRRAYLGDVSPTADVTRWADPALSETGNPR